MADEQHVYKHEDGEPEISVKAEKNTKGYNYEAKVVVRGDASKALEILKDTIAKLEAEYGRPAA
jgi:hypothetical protein